MRGAVGAAALIVCCLALAVAPAVAISADFTWSGGSSGGTPGWMTGSNWVGGTAPSGTVGTLTFPDLGSCPSTSTCYTSNNNVTGLVVNQISINDAVPYGSPPITGNAITLTGGIAASNPSGASSCCAQLNFPITLGAANTWSVDGTNGGLLGVGGGVSGSSHPLAINVSNNSELALSGDNEVGPVSITGPDTTHSGQQASLNGSVFLDGKLNGTDGNAVSLTDAQLASSVNFGPSTVGPLTSTGGQLSIVSGVLTVQGGATFDANSDVALDINGVGTTPGTDYSQLSATGAVNLANSSLHLRVTPCPLHPGDVDTLVTTTGSLVGTFSGVPDGSLVTTQGGGGCQSTLRINYNRTGTPQTVTATVVSSGSTTSVSSSANPSSPGQSVTFTATVSPSSGGGTPTGTVTFNDGSTTLGTGTLSAGTATFTTSSLSVGTHNITAVYGGDANFAGSTSSSLSQTVTSGGGGGGGTGGGSTGGGGNQTGGADTTAPGVSNYGITNSTFVVGGGSTPLFANAAKKKHKKGTTFRYTLSEAATVRIVIAQRRSGRRRGRRCVAPTHKLRHAKKCTRITTRGTLTRTSHLGSNRVAFSGRIGSRALAPGRYQAILKATDNAHNTSRGQRIDFTIVTR